MPIPTSSGTVDPAVNIRPAGQHLSHVTASLDGFLLGAVHSSGVNVHVDISGWEGAPASTGQTTQRANDHGAWLDDAWYSARFPELLVRLRGASWDHVTSVLTELLATVPVSGTVELLVYDGNLLTAQVRQSGEVGVKRHGAAADVSIGLVAPDPRRYSPEVVTHSTGLPATTGGLRLPFRTPVRVVADVESGLITVSNDGTIETHPTFTVLGPSPTFTIINRTTGAALRFHDDVPAGRSLVIDTRDRTALMDGTSPRYVSGTWPAYLPGVNQVAFTAGTHDPQATLVSEHRHAYL